MKINRGVKNALTILLLFLCAVSTAQENSDSLEAIVKKNMRDVPTAQAFNLLASRHARKNPALSKEYAYRAMLIGNDLGHELTQSASLSIFISYYQNLGKVDSAGYYLEMLRSLAEKAAGADHETVKGNYYSAAGLFYKRTGKLKEALPFFKKSAYYSERRDNKVALAGQFLNIANIYLNLSNFREALDYYFKALDKFETLGHREGQSFCLQGIGNSFAELKQYEKASDYLKKSFAIKQELGDKKGLVTAYKSMGELDSRQMNFKNAIKNFQKAFEQARALQLTNEESSISFALGKAFKALNDTVKARQYLVQSRQLAELAGDDLTKSSADMELITMRKSLNQNDSAETALKGTVEKLESIGYGSQTLSAYLHLADFYRDKGNYKKAYEAKQSYYDLRDSLKGNELTVMLNNLEEKYQSEKKEKEIAQLKRDQVISDALLREKTLMQYGLVALFLVAAIVGSLIWNRYKLINQAKRRAELEKVRNDIARDLHDDIGSTLSSINILSKVMLDSSNEKDTNGLKKIKEHSGSIMESMGDIVWAINPSNDTIDKLVSRMKEFASEILDPLNISYAFNIDASISQLKIDPARKKDIFLIVKEAINNAAKYSGCDRIDISIGHSQKNIILRIADNGVGMDVVNRSGNGLSNIESRAKALSGQADFKSSQNQGTEILVTFTLT